MARIVICESQGIVLQSFSTMLSRAGHEIVAATASACESAFLAELLRPDCVILDAPREECADAVKLLGGFNLSTILLLDERNLPLSPEELVALSCIWLQKPVTFSELLSEVNRAPSVQSLHDDRVSPPAIDDCTNHQVL